MTLELLDDDSCCDDYDHTAAQRHFHQQQRQQRPSPDSAISVKVQSAQVHDVRAQQQKETETRAEENQSLQLELSQLLQDGVSPMLKLPADALDGDGSSVYDAAGGAYAAAASANRSAVAGTGIPIQPTNHAHARWAGYTAHSPIRPTKRTVSARTAGALGMVSQVMRASNM